MLSRFLRARSTRAAVAGALVATVLAVSAGSQLQAAPQSKTLTATCTGADPDSTALLATLGGSLSLPFTVTSDVPATLDPEAPDQPISFTWGVTIDAATATKAAAVSPNLTVKDMVLDIGVSGPTATTEVQGRPAPITLALTANQPVNISQGPFSGTLTGIGKGGLIRYAPKNVGMTISLTVAGKAADVKVTCAAAGTVATTSIKIPGSPDIKQPIEIDGTANSTVNVDVLGQYVTPGTDEKGTVRPVDPSTLKVIDGPGTVQNGQVQVTAGAAGSTTSVTFEVCSGTLPGTNAVQSLKIDPSILLGPPEKGEDGQPIPGTEKPVLGPDGNIQTNLIRKSVGLTLKFGDEETPVIWTVPKATRDATPQMFQKPEDWVKTYNSDMLFWTIGGFFKEPVTFEQPKPADIQAALESLPSIGAGGVKVVQVPNEDPKKPVQYNVEFTGKNGEKDIPNLTVGNYYSVFPQEFLSAIIDAAKDAIPAPGEGGGEPGGPTLKEQIAAVKAQLDKAVAAGDFAQVIKLAGEYLQLSLKQATEDIDINQVVTVLTGLFTTPPQVATTVAGEAPIGMCSQGVIDVSVPAAVAGTTTVPPANVKDTALTGAPIKFTG